MEDCSIFGFFQRNGTTQNVLTIILLFQFMYVIAIIVERIFNFYRQFKFNSLLNNFSNELNQIAAIQFTINSVEIIKQKIMIIKTKQLFILRKELSSLLQIGITAPMIAFFALVVRINQLFSWNHGCGEYTFYDLIVRFFEFTLFQLALATIISVLAISSYFYFKNRYEDIEMKLNVVSTEFICMILKRNG